MSDRDAPAPNAENAVAKNARTKHAATLGFDSAELTTRPATDAAVPSSVQMRSRRRSSASAAAPPMKVNVSSGINSTSAIRPTANVDPVSV